MHGMSMGGSSLDFPLPLSFDAFSLSPQCSTIPKLMLSDHADPITGKRSMWTFCESCGSCDMVV